MKNKTNETPWWNRPITGKNSVFEIIGNKNKTEIPAEDIQLHKNYMAEFKTIGTIAKTLNSDKFSSSDFIFFLKIKDFLDRNAGDYIGLKYSADLLEVAIKAKNSFLAVDQAELQYRSLKQQAFYDHVINLLNQDLDKEEFKAKIQEKLEQILPEVKSDQGQEALENYVYHLNILSEDNLGLKLLALFKQYSLADYSILNKVADMMNSLDKDSLTETNLLAELVEKNFDVFEKLSPIIGIKEYKVNHKTFVRLIQYLALKDKHRESYQQFETLILTLQDWKKAYDCTTELRAKYPAQTYKVPPEFEENFPAIDVYRKYEIYLEA
jgi:hypothetical protein